MPSLYTCATHSLCRAVTRIASLDSTKGNTSGLRTRERTRSLPGPRPYFEHAHGSPGITCHAVSKNKQCRTATARGASRPGGGGQGRRRASSELLGVGGLVPGPHDRHLIHTYVIHFLYTMCVCVCIHIYIYIHMYTVYSYDIY